MFADTPSTEQHQARDANRAAWALHLGAALVLEALALLRAFSSRNQSARGLDFLDSSWQLDILAKARQHLWLGRDVVFTYGPLYQELADKARLDNGTLGSLLNASRFFPVALTIFFIYGATALLLQRQRGWRRTAGLLLIVAFWLPLDPKLPIAFFGLALFLTLMRTEPFGWRAALGRAAIAAAFIIFAFLIAADAGVYASAGCLIVVFARAAMEHKSRSIRRLLTNFLQVAMLVLLGALIVNAVLVHPFDFEFWKATAAIVSDYRWAEPWAMFRGLRVWLLLRCVIAAAVLAYSWIRTDRQSTDQLSSLLAGGLFGVVSLQTALVRSDFGHLVDAIFPLAAFSVILLLRCDLVPFSGRKAWIASALAFAFSLLGSGSWLLRDPFAFLHGASAACNGGEANFEQVCGPPDAIERLRSAAGYLDSHSGSNDSVAIFPWENVYGIAAHKRVAGGVLQNYIAAGAYLSQRQITGLEKHQPPLALYSIDGVATKALDFVPNFTRTPEIWLYLQKNYELQSHIAPGLLALQAAPERARKWSEAVAPIEGGNSSQLRPKVPVQLLPRAINVGDFDFLKITLRLRYPIWWKLLKPSEAKISIGTADGGMTTFDAVIPPNQRYELWIFPWNASELARLFEPDPSTWRSDRPAPTSAIIEFSKFDSFSVFPQRLEIEKVEAVTISLQGGSVAPGH